MRRKVLSSPFSAPWFLIFVIVLSVISLSSPLSAEIGGIGSFNLAKMAFSGQNTGGDFKYLSRISLGVYYAFYFSDALSFQAEFNYANKGCKQTQTINTDVSVIEFKTSYLELPLSVKYKFKTEGTLQPYILGGGYGALKLSAKSNAYTKGSKTTVVTDMDDLFHRFDYGLHAGLGCYYVWKEIGLFFAEIRYSYGLKNIYKDTGINPMEFKNRLIAFTLGVGF